MPAYPWLATTHGRRRRASPRKMRALRTRRRAVHRRRDRRGADGGRRARPRWTRWSPTCRGSAPRSSKERRAWTSTTCASPSRCCRARRLPRHRRLGLVAPQPRALRRGRARCRSTTSDDGARRHERLLQRASGRIFIAVVDARQPRSPAWLLLCDRQPAQARSAARQHHRPRLGRGPARDEQPAAALVDVAVRAHHRVRAASTWSLYPGPGQLRRAAAAGPARGEYDAEQAQARRASWRRSTRSSPRMTAEALARDPQAMAIGERLFLNNCAHVPRLRRARQQGLPEPDRQRLAVRRRRPRRSRRRSRDGRSGVMPPMAAAVGSAEDVQNVANYVLSLSGSPHDSIARAARQARSSPPAPPATAPTARATRRSARPTSPTRSGCTAGARRRSSRSINNGKTNVMPAQSGRLTDGADPRARAPTSGACRSKPAQPRRTERRRRRAAHAVDRREPARHPDRRRRGGAADASLYEAQTKIYPRAVQRLVRALALGAGAGSRSSSSTACRGSTWNGRQAVLFDLARAQVLHLRPGALAAGLHLPHRRCWSSAALSLFLFTAVAGRLWCGYACPQTVYTEIFLWIERRIEGDRSARMKLDAGAVVAATSSAQEAAKHVVVDRARAVDRLHLRRLLHADPRRWRTRSLHVRARARGRRSGSCSTASPPTATPAACASRCASTCARMRASRARCSTATR